MNEPKTFPIFSMINDFESKSFHYPELKAQHRSLYYFLLGLLMHRRGANLMPIAFDYGMAGSKIGNYKTYTNTLRDLQTFGFLTYTPGKNRFSTPIIDMHFCKSTASLLQAYCKSIGSSTAYNIKALDTKDTQDTREGDTPPNLIPDLMSEIGGMQVGQPDTTGKTEYRESVFLLPSEYTHLLNAHGKEKTEWMLDKLNNYKLAHSKQYDSDYRAILKWVVDAAQKDFIPTPTRKMVM